VIQLSPAEGARVLPASTLQVRDPAGRSSVARSVDARALQDAGMPVSDGSSMLRTGATSAAGAYTLQSAQAQGRYVVQVLEPNSPLRLEVQANQAQVLAGGNVQLQARLLEDGATTAQLASRRGGLGGEALLVAPDGRSWPQRLLRTTDGACARRCASRPMSAACRGCGNCRCSPRPMACCAMAGGLRGGTADRALQWPGGTGPGQPPGGAAIAGGRRWPLRGTRHAVCHGPRWPVEAGRAGMRRRGSMARAQASWCCRSTRPHCRPASVRRTSCATCSCRTRAGWHRSSRARWRCGSEPVQRAGTSGPLHRLL
jgi:hypothetical protein